ncbi:unnamed protein product [Ectocarpus sp. 12 AP-2014]
MRTSVRGHPHGSSGFRRSRSSTRRRRTSSPCCRVLGLSGALPGFCRFRRIAQRHHPRALPYTVSCLRPSVLAREIPAKTSASWMMDGGNAPAGTPTAVPALEDAMGVGARRTLIRGAESWVGLLHVGAADAEATVESITMAGAWRAHRGTGCVARRGKPFCSSLRGECCWTTKVQCQRGKWGRVPWLCASLSSLCLFCVHSHGRSGPGPRSNGRRLVTHNRGTEHMAEPWLLIGGDVW